MIIAMLMVPTMGLSQKSGSPYVTCKRVTITLVIVEFDVRVCCDTYKAKCWIDPLTEKEK